MWLFALFTLFWCHTIGDRPVNWENLNCPSSDASQSCTYRNTNNVDMAISLFFQTEDDSGSWFMCVSDNARYYNSNININNNPNPNPNILKASQCPTGMTYSKGSDGWNYCLLTGITFPSNPTPYCEYLTNGYEGFTYADSSNPNYKCPPNMRFGQNSEGTDFCTYDIPSSYTLPKGAEPACTTQDFASHQLGFKWGGPPPTLQPSAHPNLNSTVYCDRSWTSKQMGSAGDCFFILPAGESYRCYGHGTTNMIGAHGVKLNKNNFKTNTNSVIINCPSLNNTLCKYPNPFSTDVYITTSFHSQNNNIAELQCSYKTNLGSMISVCNFTSNAADSSSYSCGFILPAGKILQCSQNGNMAIDSSVLKPLTSTYLKDSEPIKINNDNICPPVTYPNSTFCDCYYENIDNKNDVLVIMQSTNADNQFNSYHCYVWGVNVCAWGANNNNLKDSGGCYFILPAGAMYNCSMQWGSTAFTYSTMLKLNGSIYTPYNGKYNKYQNQQPTKVIGNVLTDSRPISEMKYLFKLWQHKYNKYYDNEKEKELRFKNFRQFISLADNTNKNKVLFKNIIHLADLSKDEFESYYRGCALPMVKNETNDKLYIKFPNDFNINSLKDLPTSVDWRTKGAVTPVKNQGQCGSCWSFSTTGVLESAWFLAGNPLVSLSEQTLVSCEKDCYACNGGWPYKAINYVHTNGIDTEASYPYVSGDGHVPACEQSEHQAANIKVKGYKFIESNENTMQAYVAQYGPISISLDAMTQLWWPYTGGIMTECCNKSPDHAVLIVGYGHDDKTNDNYWIVKNSWGTDWGIDGYIYLQMGTDQCGITYQPVVPVL